MGYTAVVIASAAISNYQSNKQEAFQERQERIQQSQAATRRFSQRRRQLREQRIKAAQIQQAAITTGVSESSGEIGATGALATNFAANEAFLRGEERLSQQSATAARSLSSGARKAAIGRSVVSAVGVGLERKELLDFRELEKARALDAEAENLFDDPSIF